MSQGDLFALFGDAMRQRPRRDLGNGGPLRAVTLADAVREVEAMASAPGLWLCEVRDGRGLVACWEVERGAGEAGETPGACDAAC